MLSLFTAFERGRSTGAEFGSTSAHQSCTTTAALASGHASRHVQDSHTLMHQILHKRCPSYLADLVTFNTTYSQRRHLRSSTTRYAAVRRARTQFGKRAFSVCGPVVWNSLPIALRNMTVVQFSGVHSSHIYLAVLFPHN